MLLQDLDMYDPISDTPAAARTSNLNEDLGQIKYIFSDKTGTLTDNKMIFRQCSIGGVVYGQFDQAQEQESPAAQSSQKEKKKSKPTKPDQFIDTNLAQTLHNGGEKAELIHDFLLAITLCQTVVPEVNIDDADKPFYLASSPDEAALVSAAAQFEYTFLKRQPNKITTRIRNWKTEKFDVLDYELLDVLDFNSDRKRMSVIVKTPQGQILLLCKGADNVICERLGQHQPFLVKTLLQLEDFAKKGLRTLCVASAEIPSGQYTEWKRQYLEASTVMENRKQRVAEVKLRN